jgi:RHS repeat-associated protein
VTASGQGPTGGQVPTGTPPFGTFASNSAPDVINLANLNAHIPIPIVHKAGRGTDFTYDLSYDSSVWYPVTSGSIVTWTPVNNFGWRAQTEITTGYISYTGWLDSQPHCVYYDYTNWVYHDPWGVQHPFTGEIATAYSGGNSQYCGTRYFQGFSSGVRDGSGYSIVVPTNTTGSFPGATIYGRDGKVYGVPFNTGSGSGNFTDRNGNQITVSGASFYDTLSSTNPVLTVSGSGTPSSPMKFTYTAPSLAQPSYTLNYTNYTVATNFGIPGIVEFKSTAAVPLVTSVVLPDNSQYTIQYETTPGACTPYAGTTCVTARIKSVILPTGGSINYTYTGGNNGVFADGTTAGLTRALSDGASWNATWNYTRLQGTGAASETTVKAPDSNQSILQFQGIYETQSDVYQGSAPTISSLPISESTLQTAGLLQELQTCYNGSTTPCTGTAITLPIASQAVTTIFPGSGGLQSKVISSYNSYGRLSEEDDYGFAAGTPGSLFRKKIIQLQTVGTYNAVQYALIADGSGNVLSQTNMTFDEGNPTPTTGTPQHQNPTVGRGNPTTITYRIGPSSVLMKHLTFFDTGNVATIKDVNNAINTYNYPNSTLACGNAFPTSVTEAISTLSQSMVWNCTGGVPSSVTDENGNVVSTSYTDPDFWRPNSTTDQQSNVTNLAYGGETSFESVMNFNSINNSTSDTLVTLDGLGRSHISQTKQSSSLTTYDSVETDYDVIGRPSRVTLPYSGNAGQTNSSAPAVTTSYDALNRPMAVTDAGGGTISYTYPQNDVYQTLGPKPSGENNPKSKQLEYDSLGRLTSVCEITGLIGSGPCAQTSPATGYWTKYTYDANGNLTGVTQNAQGSSQQTRTYVYDDLSRVISETNPETASISYTYDSDSTCGTSSGDLVKKIDAIGDTICYSYDALHRHTSTTYPSGMYSSITPSRYFTYDSATVNNVSMKNTAARLAEAYTCFSPCSSKITDLGLSYTARGETTDTYESTLNSGGYYHSSATFWANGALNVLSDSLGYSLTYGVDGEGRIFSTTDSGGAHPLASTLYNNASQPTQINLGYSGDVDSYAYDPNTGRMLLYAFNVGTQNQFLAGLLTWNANGSLQNLNTQDLFNTPGTQGCNYLHDDLSRVASVNCEGNQLQNPGFESGNVDWALNSSWSINNIPANAESGNWYLSGSSTVETVAYSTVNGGWIPVSAGETITFGGFIKRIGGTGILDWGCAIVDANHNPLAYCPPGAGPWDGTGGTSWQLYSLQTTIPTNGAYVLFYAEVHGFGDTDTSLTTGYFDSAFMDGAPVWAQQFTYDAFGNINKAGNSSFNASYSSATNRMTQIANSIPTYDANGNVLNDFLHTYTWDANGRAVTVDGVGITYDALGRMVEQNHSGVYIQKIYSPTGFQMQIVNGQTNVYSFSPNPGGGATVWSVPAGTVYYRHADWLGSSRLASTYTRTVLYDGAYAPFGEQYANSGTTDLSFTGMDQDTSSNLYDFPAREYGIQGRWPSPDPAGFAAVDTSNPQSWNRYAYVGNNPLAVTDPTGMDPGIFPCFDPISCVLENSIGLIFEMFLFQPPPPPQAPPAPPGGYGTGIDPYGTWDEKLPAGVQVFPSSVTGIPNGSDCTYGSGDCGGMIYGFSVGSVNLYRPNFNVEFLFWILQAARANMPSGKQLIQQANHAFEQCVSSKGLSRTGVAVLDTTHDAAETREAPSSNGLLLNVAGAALDLQKECLGENAPADLSPNYKGLFHAGNPGVNSIGGFWGWLAGQ